MTPLFLHLGNLKTGMLSAKPSRAVNNKITEFNECTSEISKNCFDNKAKEFYGN